jgi:AraC-like DNA-binding protein
MKPYIRSGVLENFRATADYFNLDYLAVLSEAGVPPDILSTPGVYLDFPSYMKLLATAASAAGAPHFGLEMARTGGTETLGDTGISMRQATTVGEAWHSLEQYYLILDTYGQLRVSAGPDEATLSYIIPDYSLPGARQVVDVAAAIAYCIMKQLYGQMFKPLGFSFPYDEPRDITCYDSLDTQELCFGTPSMTMRFDPAILNQTLQLESPQSVNYLDSYFAARGGLGQFGVSRRVEDIIRRLLPTGQCNLPLVSSTLGVPARTLQTQLEVEKSSFRDLLEKVRREIATYHLRRGDMPLTQLAMVLGYSELSAFSRSFRQWYGMSPRQWGQQYRIPSSSVAGRE